MRYFSGSAIYRTSVLAPQTPTHRRSLARFSDVHELARIRINGHKAGTIWALPFALNVGRWLRYGQNSIEIEVTNLWPNRFIGDLQSGTTTHCTETNLRAYRAQSPLLPLAWSGISNGNSDIRGLPNLGRLISACTRMKRSPLNARQRPLRVSHHLILLIVATQSRTRGSRFIQ